MNDCYCANKVQTEEMVQYILKTLVYLLHTASRNEAFDSFTDGK